MAGGKVTTNSGIPTAQAELNRPRCQLAGDLADSQRQGVLEGKPNGWLESSCELSRKRTGLITARFGSRS